MKKPGKPPPKVRKKTSRAARSGKVANESASAKPLRRAAEGPDNLRQRAEWFRARAGNVK
jgi:hypothetical protein